MDTPDAPVKATKAVGGAGNSKSTADWEGVMHRCKHGRGRCDAFALTSTGPMIFLDAADHRLAAFFHGRSVPSIAMEIGLEAVHDIDRFAFMALELERCSRFTNRSRSEIMYTRPVGASPGSA